MAINRNNDALFVHKRTCLIVSPGLPFVINPSQWPMEMEQVSSDENFERENEAGWPAT
jgi:hypothetical protein